MPQAHTSVLPVSTSSWRLEVQKLILETSLTDNETALDKSLDALRLAISNIVGSDLQPPSSSSLTRDDNKEGDIAIFLSTWSTLLQEWHPDAADANDTGGEDGPVILVAKAVVVAANCACAVESNASISRPTRNEARRHARSLGDLALSMLEKLRESWPADGTWDHVVSFRELRGWPLVLAHLHEADGLLHCAERVLEQMLYQPAGRGLPLQAGQAEEARQRLAKLREKMDKVIKEKTKSSPELARVLFRDEDGSLAPKVEDRLMNSPVSILRNLGAKKLQDLCNILRDGSKLSPAREADAVAGEKDKDADANNIQDVNESESIAVQAAKRILHLQPIMKDLFLPLRSSNEMDVHVK